jgi:enterochelin esterase family protein
MKNLLIILAIIVQTGIVCFGQESGKPLPAATNIAGAEFPKILPDLSVQFRTIAPDAQKVQIDLGKKYDMLRSDDGSWTVTTDPQVPGFHYYSLVIDGISVADPASEAFYGMGRMASAIEIPEKGVGFYEIRDVPHGTISSKYYFSKLTNSWRHLFVYTPPGYDVNSNLKYPVVYIQHGGGEDERGWAQQGKTDIIVDNLIAEGKARPMIVVMANGNVRAGTGGYSSEAMAAFKNEMTQNIVPFIDKNFRTMANAKNRSICGLSMGGGQSFYVGLQSLDCFGSVGIFSSGIFGGIRNPSGNTFDAEKEIPGLLTQSGEFNKNLDLFYISCGEQDPRIEFTKKAVATMKESGLEVQFNSFPGNHEWQVWRKSLYDFASRVFK